MTESCITLVICTLKLKSNCVSKQNCRTANIYKNYTRARVQNKKGWQCGNRQCETRQQFAGKYTGNKGKVQNSKEMLTE